MSSNVKTTKPPHKKGLPRLFELSAAKRGTIIFSSIFSALASLVALAPYFASYLIVCEFITYAENLEGVDRGYILTLGLCALGGVVASMLLNGAAFTLSHFAAYRILYNLRLALSRHLALLPLGFFTSTSKGEIHKTLQENVELIENFIAHKIPEFIQAVVGAVAIFILFFVIDWRLALVCVGVYVVAMGVQFSVYGKDGAKKEIKRFFDSLERINASSIEFVRAMPIVKMFSKSIFSFQAFSHNVRDYRDYTLGFAKRCMPSYNVFLVFINSFVLFVLPVGVAIIAQDPQDIVFDLTLFCVIIFSTALIAPLLKISNLSRSLMQINEGVERIDKIFSTQPLAQSENPKMPKDFSIEFKNVSFGYKRRGNVESSVDSADSKESSAESTADSGALHNISFRVESGQSLAIIGRSGSGKSTILSLIARFYDVESGSILIGGVDIREMSEKSLMDCLSMVFQESFLFRDSLKENVRAGSFEASEEEILQALKLAQCEEILQKFSLDSIIGQSMDLSGGEAQRINIARAFVKNSPILLLDEITSSLDVENERKITRALESLKAHKTTILVSHKLNSIINADNILLLDKGRILAFGTHAKLMESSKEYKAFYELYKDTAKWQIHN
ncbi:hypothetical protein CQA49_06260 [Helicobacter sp. MIT 00-7814]|uniref:ABC transporter ATP-binding protein n=1 Tax=unclassified Helicobacter TaxID=2593540 RepID=UPI000E1ED7DF|nr:MULTISPECIES: ABC transporter ATP-binding protein [unclassified Helicobacter]RDU53660.1 hypothetical protein CQA49_06260 [Helicobacter sp. MIT 00-7814]RDU54032.1 hypothetical protein CQA37_06225 [Helicobacter sp. MIT 99-10781]